MALPTIKDIAEMMKTFTKGMNLPPKLPKEILNKTVNLSPEIPSPDDSEQCLNSQDKGRTWSPRSSHYSNSSFEEYSDESNNNGGSTDHSPISTVTNISLKEEPKTEPEYLILVGCTECMKYMMVAKTTVACPKCNGELMFFDQLSGVVPPPLCRNAQIYLNAMGGEVTTRILPKTLELQNPHHSKCTKSHVPRSKLVHKLVNNKKQSIATKNQEFDVKRIDKDDENNNKNKQIRDAYLRDLPENGVRDRRCRNRRSWRTKSSDRCPGLILTGPRERTASESDRVARGLEGLEGVGAEGVGASGIE
uniref:Uncharacterized protein n=1 Tax=Ananas comosus var. bracteatus TaxID=296719 RepID=A0A6V7QUV3_ANACO